MDALELEGEHKPEPARRGVELDEAADFPPSAFKPARTEMKRAEQAHLPLGFNPFRCNCLPRVDDAEPEASVGYWKISTQTVSTVGVLGVERIQGAQYGTRIGTGFDFEKTAKCSLSNHHSEADSFMTRHGRFRLRLHFCPEEFLIHLDCPCPPHPWELAIIRVPLQISVGSPHILYALLAVPHGRSHRIQPVLPRTWIHGASILLKSPAK
ncbi:hypothetical protein [Stenotrophomonas maltophilia]|uniref:hypothetical protein n=1 Tax=Stenotrophomonas maltophilia TaxID=40324 RepID=UPI001FA7F8BB|nr:hypothetical protein [Stenotrophomonas maltophilia]